MGTTENMYRHSVLSPYSSLCTFSVLKYIIFSSVLVARSSPGPGAQGLLALSRVAGQVHELSDAGYGLGAVSK